MRGRGRVERSKGAYKLCVPSSALRVEATMEYKCYLTILFPRHKTSLLEIYLKTA